MPGNKASGKATGGGELVLRWKRDSGQGHKGRNDSEPDPDFDPILLSKISEKVREKIQYDKTDAGRHDHDQPLEPYVPSGSDITNIKVKKKKSCCPYWFHFCCCRKRKKKNRHSVPSSSDISVTKSFKSTDMRSKHRV